MKAPAVRRDKTIAKASAPVIAVTGGIACGKSEVGRILAAAGVAVKDADHVARALLDPGTKIFKAVVNEFGRELLDRNGAIDRSALARRVFADANARARLEALMHPEIIREITAWRDEQRAGGRAAAALVPLLFEAGAEQGWDAIFCVVDRADRVRARLLERGLSEHEARLRVSAQWPIKEKARRSDVVLHNEAGLRELERTTMRAWHMLSERRRMHNA